MLESPGAACGMLLEEPRLYETSGGHGVGLEWRGSQCPPCRETPLIEETDDPPIVDDDS